MDADTADETAPGGDPCCLLWAASAMPIDGNFILIQGELDHPEKYSRTLWRRLSLLAPGSCAPHLIVESLADRSLRCLNLENLE
jgi:hypothetical protein